MNLRAITLPSSKSLFRNYSIYFNDETMASLMPRLLELLRKLS
jgi:hypothetical protein